MLAHELTTDLLRAAYSNGYFPMPHPETGETMWFSPDPRAIIPLDGFHTSKSLLRTLRKSDFSYTIDQAFSDVMNACGDRPETWITPEFKDVYTKLHLEGDAHSVEVWSEGKLVGGVYGVSLGGAFFAESMFHYKTDASKAALRFLVSELKARGMRLLEVQFMTEHLRTLGAIGIPKRQYFIKLKQALSSGASWSKI